jgi:hypothetical protein
MVAFRFRPQQPGSKAYRNRTTLSRVPFAIPPQPSEVD